MGLAQALFRLPWTATLAGARQLSDALAPLGSGPAMRALLPPLARLLANLPAAPTDDLSWQEFRNKWEVLNSVENPPAESQPLAAMVREAYSHYSFYTLWIMEGLGQQFANSALEREQPVRGLLNGERAAGVPARAMSMLHAGMGLAFASAILQEVEEDSRSALSIALHKFVSLCRMNSRPGYLGMALESLGLVTRMSYESLVRLIDAQLPGMSPHAVSYFWHGVGRAIYFLPVNLLPASEPGAREFQTLTLESPHELAYLNSLAGLAWAVSLVNMRQPRILETVLGANLKLLPAAGAFANGVFSAAAMRKLIFPEDPFLPAFCKFLPQSDDSAFLALWKENVKIPCERALRSSVNRPEDLFRYRRAA